MLQGFGESKTKTIGMRAYKTEDRRRFLFLSLSGARPACLLIKEVAMKSTTAPEVYKALEDYYRYRYDNHQTNGIIVAVCIICTAILIIGAMIQ